MRSSRGGRFSAGDRSFTSDGQAISYAITLACRKDSDPGTYYVRELGAMDAVARIERHAGGVVTVKRLRES